MKREYVARDGYNYDVEAAGLEDAIECKDASLTQQNMKDEADINVLVKRFGITGVMPQNVVAPTYQDFEDVFDYQTAQNAILEANKAFMAMPADVRSRFGNDPQNFVEFASNPENVDEMVKMGLAVAKPVEEPAKPVEVVVLETKEKSS
ncbi:MAG: internal scaffolding protein [Microvirus sp.]|nr:MAG: internal scaffolding protein [Microvirus sp.]